VDGEKAVEATTQTSNFGIGVSPLDRHWRNTDGVRWMYREVPAGVAAIRIDHDRANSEVVIRWKLTNGEIHDAKFSDLTPQYEIRNAALVAMKLTC
jgi:hypothetical protein